MLKIFVRVEVSILALPVLVFYWPQHACMCIYALITQLSHVKVEDLESAQPKLLVQRPPCRTGLEIYLNTTFISFVYTPLQQQASCPTAPIVRRSHDHAKYCIPLSSIRTCKLTTSQSTHGSAAGLSSPRNDTSAEGRTTAVEASRGRQARSQPAPRSGQGSNATLPRP